MAATLRGGRFCFTRIFKNMTKTALRSFIRHVLHEALSLDEGGNVEVGGRAADKIEVARVGRERFVEDMRSMFRKLDQMYREYTMSLGQEVPLYDPAAIDRLLAGPGFGGSTAIFFDLTRGDELFATKKKKLGDIDVYIPRETYVNLFHMLRGLEGQRIIDLPEERSIDYIGQIDEDAVGNQINSLFVYNFVDPNGDAAQINMQIDFVKARFTGEGLPHSSIIHSHGSSELDMMSGIKGFAKNYLVASLTSKLTRVRGKLATPKSTPDKITVSKSIEGDELALYTFSTDYGFRQAREKLGVKDEYDVYINIAYADDRVLETAQGFKMLYGVEPSPDDLELFNSYLGNLQLMKKYLSDASSGDRSLYESIFDSIVYKCFDVEVKGEEPNDIKITLAQSTEKENFDLDREVKTSMINAFYDEFPSLLARKPEVDEQIERYYKYLPVWAEGYRARKDKKSAK